jgi:ABC-type polysaccharide transport system permease subunit
LLFQFFHFFSQLTALKIFNETTAERFSKSNDVGLRNFSSCFSHDVGIDGFKKFRQSEFVFAISTCIYLGNGFQT